MQRERQHPIAFQAAAPQIGRDLSAHVRQRGRHREYSVELLLGPVLLPFLVVQVLAAAGRIGPDGLDVPVGIGTDPHVLPSGRDDEVIDALQRRGVGDRCVIGVVIGEPTPTAHPAQAGTADYAAPQPHANPPVQYRQRCLTADHGGVLHLHDGEDGIDGRGIIGVTASSAPE